MSEATGFVVVPASTYRTMCGLLRSWDAWLLSGQEKDELFEEVSMDQTAFLGSDEGARMEEPLRPIGPNIQTVCADTFIQAVNGACVEHGGDACLIVTHVPHEGEWG